MVMQPNLLSLALWAMAVSAAHFPVPSDKKCRAHKSQVELLKIEVQHPLRFCGYYLLARRSVSPFAAVHAESLETACACFLKKKGRPLPKYTDGPVHNVYASARCRTKHQAALEREFAHAEQFCHYYKTSPRSGSPMANLDPKQIFQGCRCVLEAPTKSTTKRRTTKSRTTKRRTTKIVTSRTSTSEQILQTTTASTTTTSTTSTPDFATSTTDSTIDESTASTITTSMTPNVSTTIESTSTDTPASTTSELPVTTTAATTSTSVIESTTATTTVMTTTTASRSCAAIFPSSVSVTTLNDYFTVSASASYSPIHTGFGTVATGVNIITTTSFGPRVVNRDVATSCASVALAAQTGIVQTDFELVYAVVNGVQAWYCNVYTENAEHNDAVFTEPRANALCVLGYSERAYQDDASQDASWSS